jgi:hypothetical protein
MTIQTIARWGAALFLILFVSGCMWRHHPRNGEGGMASECRTQASCNYNGQYEPGERGYAEQEAKRLNNAETQRLQRSW